MFRITPNKSALLFKLKCRYMADMDSNKKNNEHSDFLNVTKTPVGAALWKKRKGPSEKNVHALVTLKTENKFLCIDSS